MPLAVPQIPVRRHRLRARLGSFDPLTVLAISVVVAVGVVMATMVVTFRH